MENTLTSDQIIREAFKDEDPLIINEIAKETSIKFLGEINIDLYITTTRIYLEKRIKSNILRIKNSVIELSEKTIRDVYVNQVKVELSITELKNQSIIKTIDIDAFISEKTMEISGENDIVKESSFKYDASVLNKKKVTLELYNSSMNKQFKTEINTSVLSGVINHFLRNKLKKKISGLLSLKYEPVNNDTQEVIDLLNINIKN